MVAARQFPGVETRWKGFFFSGNPFYCGKEPFLFSWPSNVFVLKSFLCRVVNEPGECYVLFTFRSGLGFLMIGLHDLAFHWGDPRTSSFVPKRGGNVKIVKTWRAQVVTSCAKGIFQVSSRFWIWLDSFYNWWSRRRHSSQSLHEVYTCSQTTSYSMLSSLGRIAFDVLRWC